MLRCSFDHVLLLSPFFVDFGSILVPKMVQQSLNIFKKTASKLPSDFELFSTPFSLFLRRFSTPVDTQNRGNTLDYCSFSYCSCFFLALSSWIDFGPSWPPFRLVLVPFFPPSSNPKADKKNTIFESFFYRCWSDFSLHFGTPALRHSPVLGHLPLSWVISRCLGSSPALRCDFLLSWLHFSTVFQPFSLESGLEFLLR